MIRVNDYVVCAVDPSICGTVVGFDEDLVVVCTAHGLVIIPSADIMEDLA